MDIAFALNAGLGVAVGLVLALTGSGGGVLAVPLLVFALNLRVSDAAPIAMLAVGMAAGVGTVLGLRTRHVRYRAAALMACAGFAGAPIGLWLSTRIPNGPLLLLFALMLVVSDLRMLRHIRLQRAGAGPAPRRGLPTCALDPQTGRLHWTLACARTLGGAGLLAGILSTLLGVGGGVVIVPALMRVSDLDMPSVTATTLAVITLIAAAGVSMTWASGQPVLWGHAIPFMLGTTAGLLAGRRVAVRVPGWRLTQTVAYLGLFVAVTLAVRALRY